jgi:hypothetical protein
MGLDPDRARAVAAGTHAPRASYRFKLSYFDKI